YRHALLGARVDLDRVDDLLIAGTSTQISVDRFGDLLAARGRVGVDEVLGAQGEARRAEAALDARGGDERKSQQIAVVLGDALERDDGAAVRPFSGHRARNLGVAIDERKAAAALPLRLAAVLRGQDAALAPQHLEQRRSGRDLCLAGLAVQ